jgi:hypothetical protein
MQCDRDGLTSVVVPSSVSLSLSVVVSLDAVLFEKFSKLGAEEEYRSSLSHI